MTRVPWVVAVALAAAFSANRCSAASFSSTALVDELRTGSVRLDTRIHNRNQTYFLRSLRTGVDAVQLTVDTDADTGEVSDIEFKPFDGVPSSGDANVNVNFTIVVTPADFPLPAVTRQVQGQYRERVMITNVTNDATAQFDSSDTAPIIGSSNGSPYFAMRNNVALSPGGFTVHGTYEAITPTQTMTVPFSVAFVPNQTTSNRPFESRITGGSDFGDGFPFESGMSSVVFTPVNPLIYDDVLDDVAFRAEFRSIDVFLMPNAPIPEPSSMSFGAVGLALALVAARRR